MTTVSSSIVQHCQSVLRREKGKGATAIKVYLTGKYIESAYSEADIQSIQIHFPKWHIFYQFNNQGRHWLLFLPINL